METRLKINEQDPEGYTALVAFDKYLKSTSISPIQKELIKIRASQINGCSFCIDSHTTDARKMGESERRIYSISTWRDTPFFTEEERAILALTEEVTLISQRVSDKTFNHAVNILGEKYVAQVIMAIIIINSWNRLAISTNIEPVI